MPNERLFVAAKVAAAWPEILPKGRLIAKELRHLTLAFLGSTDREALINTINQFPLPSWGIGPSGLLDQWIFLPDKTPRVVAAHPLFLSGEKTFFSYQKELSTWLFLEKFLPAIDSSFFPHVSIARTPFDRAAWATFSCQIPFFIQGIALFKSLGHSNYEILWQKESLAPFEEIEHTADIAYHIRGKNFADLTLHALLALAFSFPAFSRYFSVIPVCTSVDEIVSLLNRWISEIDIQEGIGLKAVSYHATLEEKDFLQWTMIVDV